MNGIAERPAETGGALAGAIATLIVYFAGIEDPAILSPIIIVVGAVPGFITGLVGLVRHMRSGGGG